MSDFKKSRQKFKIERQRRSGLSSFVERPMPSPKEVASFERVVRKEARQQEIDSHLSEIYRDKNGRLINVRKMNVRQRHVWRRFFGRLLGLVLLAALLYGAYIFFFRANNDLSAVELKLSAPENVIAGQEFSYTINYHNATRFSLTQVHLEMQYPNNFVFLNASLPPTTDDYGWDLEDMARGANASLTITGQLINQPGSVNIAFARLSYAPDGLSSQFKKEASVSTLVSGPGFTADLQYNQTAFLQQENAMTLILSAVENNYLGDFNITFALPPEANAGVATTSPPVTTTTTTTATSSGPVTITKSGGSSWQVSGLGPESGRQEIPLFFIINQKSASSTVTVRLEKKLANGQADVFWEKAITPTLVTSGLNLTLFVNGSQNDQAVNFGQTLNYLLSYSNQGDNTFANVAILASLTGDFLDWNSLSDAAGGVTENGAIIWTKEEIPALAEIKPGQEGEIDFFLRLKSFSATDLGKNTAVVSYAQYSVNGQDIKGDSNKSNTVANNINSDLFLNEQIRYFDENNIPVGSGPLPPAVGQKSSFRVYWTVKNDLHELSDAQVVFSLPAEVNWDDSAETQVGTLNYNESARQVVWNIGRLPLSVYETTAAFNISLTPGEDDRDKILVLSPGSTITAMDTETKALITQKTGAKTSKLEDDDIAGLSNSGRVQ